MQFSPLPCPVSARYFSHTSYRTDPRHRVIETGLAHCLSNCLRCRYRHSKVFAKLEEKGSSLIGRFRGPDHLRGPKQGSDRLKLIESFVLDPWLGRIGPMLRPPRLISFLRN